MSPRRSQRDIKVLVVLCALCGEFLSRTRRALLELLEVGDEHRPLALGERGERLARNGLRRASLSSVAERTRPRFISRSTTPLIVATSIAVRRPRRFCDVGPTSCNL